LNPLRYRGYVYDDVTQLYYLQSRYYDPEIGRFISADALVSTGQGLLGYNMFAYCGNNPIMRTDPTGQFWGSLLAAGAVAAIITGISNAISTASTGGSVQDCLIAGLVGAAAGAVGFAVAAATSFTPLGNVAGRVAATLVCDLGTCAAVNGKISQEDVAYAAVDATMDACISSISYYYNPIEDMVPQTAVNATIDGVVDVVETVVYHAKTSQNNSYTNASRAEVMIRRLTI